VTTRSSPGPIALLMPALIALLIAAGAAFVHTRFALRYFAPSAEEFLLAFLPWGPHIASAWGPHALRLAAAALFFASLPGLGAFLLRRLQTPLPLFAQAGAALIAWSTLGLALAAAGFSAPAPLKAVSAALVAAGLCWAPRAAWPAVSAVKETLRSAAGAASLAFAALYLLTTVVPETFYDALVYHLAVPQAFLQAGRLADIPDVHLSRLPGLIQTVYLWALAWSDDRLCRAITAGTGFLSAAALGAWVGARWSPRAGRWAALLFLSSPMIGVNLWSCANDVLCGFFFFLAFAVWQAAWDGKDGALDRRLLALSGAFFGAALATKYTALFGALYFALDLIARRRRARLPIYEPGLVFAAAAALPLLPWWFRTAAFTGNPFFPQAAELFGGDVPANLEMLAAWRSDAAGHRGLFFRAMAIVYDGLFGVEHGRFGFVGPALLMLLPLAPFLRYGEPARALVFGALASYALFVLSTGRLRYFIPQIGLLFALAAAALEDYRVTSGRHGQALAPLRRRLGRWRALADPAAAMRTLAALVVAGNAAWLVLVFQRYNQGWDVVWGRETASDYLKREHIGVYGNPSQGGYEHLAQLKRSGGAVSRVFIVGEARTFRCPAPSRPTGTFNVPPFVLWFQDDPSPRAFVRRLAEEGYSHLLINVPELHRITSAEHHGGETVGRLGRALDLLPQPIYRDKWVILFSVPQTGATPPRSL
jgi:hypothetical protein